MNLENNSKRGWKKAKLGEYFRVKHGYAFIGEFFSNSGPYILLTPGNFKAEGGLILKGEKEKYYVGDFPKEFLLKKNDFLIVLTDLTQNAPILGSPAFIREDNKFLHNQRLGKVIDLAESKMDRDFLYYLLNTHKVRGQIKGSATGSTVKHTAPDRIAAVEAEIPPLPIQRQIASILSAYDNLIENNERRIAILEETARTIYNEWFVRFRFPGYEQVKMVDSEMGKIPEGWKLTNLGSIIELAYGKALKATDRSQGNIPVYGSSGIVGYHDERFVSGPGIIVGRKGNVGSVFWSEDDFYPIDTVFFVRSDISLHYLYYNLRQQRFINSDSAVPGLSRHQAYALNFLLPSDELIERFEKLIKPIFSLKAGLQRKNANLRKTRDKLLPKLVAGEIDVSSWVEGGNGEAEMGEEAEAVAVTTRGAALTREVGPVESIDVTAVERPSLWE